MKQEEPLTEEKPDSFWKKVYASVVAVTVLVITALWAFSRYYS